MRRWTSVPNTVASQRISRTEKQIRQMTNKSRRRWKFLIQRRPQEIVVIPSVGGDLILASLCWCWWASHEPPSPAHERSAASPRGAVSSNQKTHRLKQFSHILHIITNASAIWLLPADAQRSQWQTRLCFKSTTEKKRRVSSSVLLPAAFFFF